MNEGKSAEETHICENETNGVHQETYYGVATVSRIDKIIGLFCGIFYLL